MNNSNQYFPLLRSQLGKTKYAADKYAKDGKNKKLYADFCSKAELLENLLAQHKSSLMPRRPVDTAEKMNKQINKLRQDACDKGTLKI